MTESAVPVPRSPEGQVLIYHDGAMRLQVRLDGQTVWLTQAAMADLYQTTPQNMTLHIKAIYAEGELDEAATCKEYLQVRSEGRRQVHRSLKHYSLDVILAVGYRVRSPRGTLFRQWATVRLRELLVKGFTLDDERIKAGRTLGADYFDELLGFLRRAFRRTMACDMMARYGGIAGGRFLRLRQRSESMAYPVRRHLAAAMVLAVLAVATAAGCRSKATTDGLPLAFENQQKVIDGLADREYVVAWVVFAGVAELVPQDQFTGTAYEVHPFHTTVAVLGDIETVDGVPPIDADGRITLAIEDPETVFGAAGSNAKEAVGSRFKFTVMERRTWEGRPVDRILTVQPSLK
ncbi:MAG TPA: RhuM family protein [Phycisphaerae bacterium]|nr:RhuM family protein [Phycisphaerae bacterium]